MNKRETFHLSEVVHHLKHYLPAQAPLKDFIHHNTLHAFQNENFHEALNKANIIFGYKTYLQIEEYRRLFKEGKIELEILKRFIPVDKQEIWMDKLLSQKWDESIVPRCGQFRNQWKENFQIDLDSMVHPILFRIVSSYLDQGISIWNFPVQHVGFLEAIRILESNGAVSFFKTNRAKALLADKKTTIQDVLKLVVGKEKYFENYLFDQQFAHPGYSGIVTVLEDNPSMLIDKRSISLVEFMLFELLLEVDTLDNYFGEIWAPLSMKMETKLAPLFASIEADEISEIRRIWQEAYEWTYYDEVINGILHKHQNEKHAVELQGLFCIDDRECSIRRHIENELPGAETYGTAGFFNVEFYFQPSNSDFRTKVCPAPLTPKYLIKEVIGDQKQKTDFHFHKRAHGLVFGWLITHTIGFWSALKLVGSILKPIQNAAAVSSSRHMHADSELTFENNAGEKTEDGLQIGYTISEMADRLEGLLNSIGLVDHFAPLIYVVGHGASSSNNTHYAGYDCGACSGRPGSVNARVISKIGNHPKVREILEERGIYIPETTQFLPVLHDTTRDEFSYFDNSILSEINKIRQEINSAAFDRALNLNAMERSRRFILVDSNKNLKKVHKAVKLRSVSLFEPRPELNHSNNTLCIVGRREITRNLFLDRRAFLNSFDYEVDPEGKYLLGILNAIAPVCGGINLEYYFSRVDNQKLGAGTKLPHNVMGLIGVANGIDGDLRTGLPSQMIEVHDPIRLLAIVEHFPDVVLKTMKINASTYEWFKNEWVRLVVIDPLTKKPFLFSNEVFEPCKLLEKQLLEVDDLTSVFKKEHANLPVYELLNH
jgi:uncharacterized protein YbcC (UPF0753/DUF2309 family)